MQQPFWFYQLRSLTMSPININVTFSSAAELIVENNDSLYYAFNSLSPLKLYCQVYRVIFMLHPWAWSTLGPKIQTTVKENWSYKSKCNWSRFPSFFLDFRARFILQLFLVFIQTVDSVCCVGFQCRHMALISFLYFYISSCFLISSLAVMVLGLWP